MYIEKGIHNAGDLSNLKCQNAGNQLILHFPAHIFAARKRNNVSPVVANALVYGTAVSFGCLFYDGKRNQPPFIFLHLILPKSPLGRIGQPFFDRLLSFESSEAAPQSPCPAYPGNSRAEAGCAFRAAFAQTPG